MDHEISVVLQEAVVEIDYAEHESTYAMFIAMTKWGIIFLVILLALMAYFLV